MPTSPARCARNCSDRAARGLPRRTRRRAIDMTRGRLLRSDHELFSENRTMALSRRALLQGATGFVAMNTLASPFQAAAQSARPQVVDCHGHYTTEPEALNVFRAAQIAALKDPSKKPSAAALKISDDQLRESVQPQLKFQRERGTDVTLFSPRAGGMGHHIGTAETSAEWSQVSNELIHRIAALYPDNFIGIGQLPQSPGVRPDNCIAELERCVKEYGFVAVNLNPDPSGGYWRD